MKLERDIGQVMAECVEAHGFDASVLTFGAPRSGTRKGGGVYASAGRNPAPSDERAPSRVGTARRVETRGRAPARVDPWARRSSRAFLEACDRAAREHGDADWTPPPSISRRVFVGAMVIARSKSHARNALAELPRAYAAAIRRSIAASSRGLERRTLETGHITARLLVAHAWALYRCGIPARRPGMALRIEGLPAGLLCQLVTNPATGKPYSRGRLFATESARARAGQKHRTNAGKGTLVLLAEAGAILKQQTPAEKAPARLCGPRRPDGTRHAFNVYWVPLERSLAAREQLDATATPEGLAGPPAPANAVDAPT